VNILWFLSLFLSLSCALAATLVQKWASRYLHLAQSSTTPQSRARLRTYLFEGVQKFHTCWVVENISLLMHTAIFLFFAGLIEFLFAASDEVATVILVAVGGLGIAYIGVTALPVFVPQCPFQTPLTPIIWYTCHFLPVCAQWLFSRSDRIRAKFEESWRYIRNGIHKLLVATVNRKVDIDRKVLKSALDLCRYDEEIETFLDAIPSYLWSCDNPGARVADIESLFNATGEEPDLGHQIVQLSASCIGRRLDSDARRRRSITCARAVWEISRAYLSQDQTVDLPGSVGIIFQQLSLDHDSAIAFAALSTVAMLERSLLKQLADSEDNRGSHGREKIVARLGKVLGVEDPLNTRYQGCKSSDDRWLIAVTEFISSVLLVIPHLENPSHRDLQANLEELCDDMAGRMFTDSARNHFNETLANVRKLNAAARPTGTRCL
jgi:Family of unknown function (DUF6535)